MRGARRDAPPQTPRPAIESRLLHHRLKARGGPGRACGAGQSALWRPLPAPETRACPAPLPRPPASGGACARRGVPQAARSRLVRSRAELGSPFMLGSGDAATQRSPGAAAASAWAACTASAARRLGKQRLGGRRGPAMADGKAPPGAVGE